MKAFHIPGEPTPKGRPRFTCIKGKPHAYTPAKTLAAEQEIGWYIRAGFKGPPLDGPVRVTVTFYCAKKTSDIDNLCKTLLDACNGIAWADDRQVVKLDATIIRGSTDPHTTVQIAEAGEVRAAA